MLRRLVLLAILFIPAAQDPDAIERSVDVKKEVVILVNEAIADSVSIGEYYASRRGIPKEQICRVRTTGQEICTWPQLRTEILIPLRAFLESRPDVLYIVPTYGVPVKTSEEKPENDGKGGPEGPITAMVSGRDYCCIDRELELLKIDHEIEGWFASKVFKAEKRLTREDGIYIVSRLDGPTADEARRLVDLALYGEAYGVEGRSLLDTRGMTKAGEGYADIDLEMKGIGPIFERHGIEFDHDDKEDVVDLATREDAAHYWGWYTGNMVCSKDTFRFRPGAVGAHLHSFSASVLRRKSQNWTGPLVHHGITGTCGTVYEPLAAGFPYGTVFFERFLQGYTFGESMTMATMFTSWMAVYVGDPLYAPYASGMKARQTKNRETAKTAYKSISTALDGGDSAKALELAREVEAIGIPYAGAEDSSFLAREARSRAAFPDRKAKGPVAELRKAIDAALAATDAKQGAALGRKAVDLSPASSDANRILARWAAELGSGREALAAAEIAEKVDPGFEALYWKGRALLLMKRPKEALAALDGALALKFDVEALRRAGEALVELKLYKEAIERLEAVVKAQPEELELAMELGKAQMAVKEWRRAGETLREALKDLPVVWGDVRPWAACCDLLAVALRGEGIDKDRAQELAQVARDLASGRIRPTSAAAAAKIGTAYDEATDATLINEMPVFEERSGGLPRLRLSNRSPGEMQVFVSGPISLSVTIGGYPGKGKEKVTELELAPGIYRIMAVVVEKGSKPHKVRKEQRVEPGAVLGLGIDDQYKVYKPPAK
ncbi:MAG TPA: TIGR03790 family protein [Planctomycetota bacterium]|nr:TIGR03790 family protein [Planctomycetota bacterium]